MRKRTAGAIGLLSLLLAACSGPVVTSEEKPPTPHVAETTPVTLNVNESNIYEICIKKILDEGQLADGDPENVRFAPQSETTTLTRADDFVAVYIEAEDGNNTALTETGIVCIAKGDASDPDWYRFGVGPVYSTDSDIRRTLQLDGAD